MPTLVFSAPDAVGIDFTVGADGTVYQGVDGLDTTPLNTVLNQSGIGGFTLDINLNSSSASAAATCGYGSGVDPALIQTWNVDYDRSINPVPDSARVKKLVINRPRSVNYTATGSSGPDTNFNFSFNDEVFDPIYFTPVSDSGSSPLAANETINGPAADEVLFDLTGGDTFITKAELIALWSEFNNNIPVLGAGVGCVTGGAVTCALSGSLTFGVGWSVTVTYEESFQWHLSQSTAPVDEGSVVALTSDADNPLALDMEDILTIDIEFPDPDNPGDTITISVPEAGWVVTDANQITFPIPSFGVYEPPYFSVIITSDQFSGSLDLGMLFTIYFLSASGLYTLTFGKTNDTLYLEDDLPNTIDVKFPNPFIKTGFVDG